MMSDHSEVATARIAPTLARWQEGIADGDLDRIASAFTADALFQGLRPLPTTGRDGVREYYDSQPAPLTVDYEILQVRPLGEAGVVAYLGAVFHLVGRDDIPTHITMVFETEEDEILIGHYHVSRVD